MTKQPRTIGPRKKTQPLPGADVHARRLGALALRLIVLARMPFEQPPEAVAALLVVSAWCTATAADLTLGTAPKFDERVAVIAVSFNAGPAPEYREVGEELVRAVHQLTTFVERARAA